jgi:hypothetical protein
MTEKRDESATPSIADRIAKQGWVSLALWMSIGLLLESLMAYKAPSYLNDLQRRELFRLAHAHGSALALLLVVVAIWIRTVELKTSPLTILTLRFGATFLPIGFLTAGIWHPEGDPGVAIWLVPVSALALIFGIISLAISKRNS